MVSYNSTTYIFFSRKNLLLTNKLYIFYILLVFNTESSNVRSWTYKACATIFPHIYCPYDNLRLWVSHVIELMRPSWECSHMGVRCPRCGSHWRLRLWQSSCSFIHSFIHSFIGLEHLCLVWV